MPNKSLHWTAQAAFLSRGCRLPSWSKLEVTMLAELVYNQTGVCTPISLSDQVAAGQPVNSSVGLAVRLCCFVHNLDSVTYNKLDYEVSCQNDHGYTS